MPLSVTLSSALQARLADVELVVAVGPRERQRPGMPPATTICWWSTGRCAGGATCPRALGFIKSHRAAYLPPEQHAMVGALAAGQRTPVFRMGTSWDRHSWYLRLRACPSAPWAGIVRVECSADLPVDEVVALADLSQVTLVRFASTEYKDARAPQNLYPIAGLERELRRRLGDSRLLYRDFGSRRRPDWIAPLGCRSASRNHCPQELPRFLIGAVQKRADHAARHQDLVDMAHEKIELGITDGRCRSEIRVFAEAASADPLVRSPHQVGADDDAVPVVFEALGGVDATDLSESFGLGCPQGRRGCAGSPRSPLRFHGRVQEPISTSRTRAPSFGSLHGQQNPAVILAP